MCNVEECTPNINYSYLYLMYFSMCFYELIHENLNYKYGSENKTIDAIILTYA